MLTPEKRSLDWWRYCLAAFLICNWISTEWRKPELKTEVCSPTCCFMRKTCSSSALISLSCTNFRDKKGDKKANFTPAEQIKVKFSFLGFFSPHLSYRRFRYKVLKGIFRSNCCEVFMQDGNFLFIVPSGWTTQGFKIVLIDTSLTYLHQIELVMVFLHKKISKMIKR